ncbi:MAG: glycosyltransferase family 4 protein [Clostridia bacterium]|nr:glycosyltransferase family 4 protein [Clostridia bacterium]
MNILYISTLFPKADMNSTIYTDLAETLAERGHRIFVVCANEKKFAQPTYTAQERGCTVLRVQTGNLYDVGTVEKAISQLTMTGKFAKAIKRQLSGEKIDLILFEAPPVTMGSIVKKARKIFNAPSLLMMKDIFPQNAVDIGMLKKGSAIYRFYSREEKKLYSSASFIGCMSEANIKYIAEHNDAENCGELILFPNTKRIKTEIIKNPTRPLRKKYNIPRDAVVFIFGGNMGRPQGIDFLCAAADKLVDRDDIFFAFVGRGTERGIVEQYVRGHKNAVLINNLPRDEYEAFVLECDVGIVSLDFRFTIPNYPSRILSYLEYSMPVLCATDLSTDMRELVEQSRCGFWCPSDNTDEFCRRAKELADDIELRTAMGQNGRRLIEERFTVDKSADIVECVAKKANLQN